jgi:hypothetical protein
VRSRNRSFSAPPKSGERTKPLFSFLQSYQARRCLPRCHRYLRHVSLQRSLLIGCRYKNEKLGDTGVPPSSAWLGSGMDDSTATQKFESCADVGSCYHRPFPSIARVGTSSTQLAVRGTRAPGTLDVEARCRLGCNICSSGLQKASCNATTGGHNDWLGEVRQARNIKHCCQLFGRLDVSVERKYD